MVKTQKFDMDRVRNVHLVGIGGCGMSGIAKILHEMGYKVSGSDVKEGANTIRLKDLGVKIYIGHKAQNVREADILIYSSAVTHKNEELKEAKAKRIGIFQRAEMLSWIMDQSKNKIAIAGTHGKTTTTAMLAKVFGAALFEPTFYIGCDMDYVGGNAKMGDGKIAIAEADESDSSFLFLSPTVEVITNIEEDHIERFGSMNVLVKTFNKFARRISNDGFIVLDATNKYNRDIMKKIDTRFITYGLEGEVEYTARNIEYDKFCSRFNLIRKGEDLGQVEMSVPGWQNVLNSLAVFAIGFEFDLDFGAISTALRTFSGARRRFQTVGEHNNILIIDDYAHHPTEIQATLSAARSGWPGRRVICIFQPHRYSRTALLKDKFVKSFGDADLSIITDIYAASEKPIHGISGKIIAEGIKESDAVYIPKKQKITEYLMEKIKEGDIIMTLGAGDINTVAREIFARLKMKNSDS
jgi:UDP-N-acetylmuramate--alanine ligase